MIEKSFEEVMTEILNGNRKPDLIVHSQAGWSIIDKSWRQRQSMPATASITHCENKANNSDSEE